MHCFICGGDMDRDTYRAVFPYFNLPAHTVSEWSICQQNLLNTNLRPLYATLATILDMKHLSPDYEDLKQWLLNPAHVLNVLTQIERLEKMLQETFPDAEIVRNSTTFVPAEVQLDSFTYQKLVAHELESTADSPAHLKYTCNNILYELQTGKFSLQSPFFYGTVPSSRATQSIRVPAELVKALRQPWISHDRSLERVLMDYAERIKVTPLNEDLAYMILKRGVRPSTIKRRAKGHPVSAITNYVQIPDLPGDKRAAVRKALQNIDKSYITHMAWELPNKPLSSTRIDYEDHAVVKKLSNDLSVPVYKVMTALLMYARYVKI